MKQRLSKQSDSIETTGQLPLMNLVNGVLFNVGLVDTLGYKLPGAGTKGWHR